MCFYFVNKAGCGAGKSGCLGICIPCKIGGANKKSLAKIGYIIFSFFWVFISFILLYTAKEVFEFWEDFIDGPEGGSACFGTSAIFRMSFVLMLFHILMLIIVLPRMTGSAYFHDGCWVTKFFLVLSVFILMFWISNSFFRVYGYFSLVMSMFFLIFQGIVIMGFGYSVNDNFMKASESNTSYFHIILILTGIVALLSLVFTILQFVWFSGGWANNILILTPIIFAALYVVGVVFKTRENGSLFTTAVMVFYILYLTWTALASRPSDSCNPFYNEEHGTVLQIIFGLIFTFLAMIVLACSTKNEEDQPENKFKDLVADDKESDDEIEETNPQGDTQKAYVFPVSMATVVFQAFMIFVSIYYAMLVTNWGRPHIDDDYDYFIDKWAGFWVKIVVQWAMGLLYLFSLLAPLIFKERSF